MKRWISHFIAEWRREENRAALWAASALVTSVFAPGVAVYLRNSGEFVFRLSSVLAVMTGIAVVMVWGIARLQLCFRKRGFQWANTLTLALAAAEWIQWTLLGQNIGVLRGSMIDWSEYRLLMWWESLLLLLILAAALCYRRKVCRYMQKLSLLCILGQLLPLAWESAVWEDPGYRHRDYRLTEERKFEFGNRSNVLVIITDAVGRNGLRQAFARYPDLADTFRDFHFFRDVISPMPRTAFAIPSILTGRLYPDWYQDLTDESIHADFLKESYFDANSLLLQFRRAGYECEGYPFTVQTLWYDPALLNNLKEEEPRETSSLIPWFDLWLFRMVPVVLKPFVINDSQWFFRQFVPAESHDGESDVREWDLVFLQGILNHFRVGERRDVMKYLHLQGGHLPLEINADCEPVRDSGREDMIEQIAGSYRIIGKLLEKMRAAGIYDQAMIVVTADHTESYSGEISTLIKRPGDTADFLRYNDTPGQVNEIAATIRQIMLPGTAPEGETRSLFDPAATGRIASVDWVINRVTPDPLAPVKGPVAPEEIASHEFWTFVSFPQGKTTIFHDQGFRISNQMEKGGRVCLVLSDPVSGEDRYAAWLPEGEFQQETGIEVTLDFSAVGDGVYAVRHVLFAPEDEMMRPLGCYASWLAVIRNGVLVPSAKAEIPGRMLHPGEELAFCPGRIFPQLKLRNAVTLASAEISMTEKSRLEIALEPEKKGFLQLNFFVASRNLAAVEFYHKDTLLGSCPIASQDPQRSILLPISGKEDVLHLRCRFRSGPLPFKRHRLQLGGIKFLPEKP